MIKTTNMSFCKTCKKSVCLYEDVKSKYKKDYYCVLCKEHVRTLDIPKEK